MISVSYFGKSNTAPAGGPSQAKTPVWSKSWNRSPFNKGVNIDWKTGTIRTPLFDDEPILPAEQLRSVSAVPNNPVPCLVKGGSSLSGYTVDVYADGISEPKTGVGVLFILEISGISAISTGSWVMGLPSAMAVTGGA